MTACLLLLRYSAHNKGMVSGPTQIIGICALAVDVSRHFPKQCLVHRVFDALQQKRRHSFRGFN